jgi:nitric oxide reductase subunit B
MFRAVPLWGAQGRSQRWMRHEFRRLWIGLVVVIVASFAVLGYYGGEIYRQAPPVPERVVTTEGDVVFTGQEIKDGQNVWQSTGGQQLGSIWGHGAYVAPDWSADWLHRESVFLLEGWAHEQHGRPFAQLPAEQRAALESRLKRELRTNTYDPQRDAIVISPARARAIDALSRYYGAIFGDAQEFPADIEFLADGGMTPVELRDAYAMPSLTIRAADRQHLLNAFFFWAAWACTTERPSAEGAEGSAGTPTYTNNWPAEALVGNAPSG